MLPASVSSPLWSIVCIWERQGLQEETISFIRTYDIVGGEKKEWILDTKPLSELFFFSVVSVGLIKD